MAKFKVGDRARLVAIRNAHGHGYWKPELIVSVISAGAGVDMWGDAYEYTVQPEGVTGNVTYGHVLSWQLEPLTPDLGSWEEIERLTKWKPQGVTA